MNKNFFIALTIITLTALYSCGGSIDNNDNRQGDSTLCQFKNIKLQRMIQYSNEDSTLFYIDNKFTAFWPMLINGEPCDSLQQALLLALTDSAELNTIDLASEYLLNPQSYLEIDSTTLKTVDAIQSEDGHVSTSDVKLRLQDMGERLVTFHIATYDYAAMAAHGIYSNSYVTYDTKTGKIPSLNDIIDDTTLLRNAIYISIKENYDYSKDDLFIPDNGLLPLPSQFYLEDQVLHVVYQVYEIASYAQGAIDAPIHPYMLKPGEMKRMFTPYGLELIDYIE